MQTIILSTLATLAAPSRAWLIAQTACISEDEASAALTTLAESGQVTIIPATSLEGGGEYYALA